MSWYRLDDDGSHHPKVVTAGNEAYGAWCRAGQWCSKHLTDGRIPREVALSIGRRSVWDRLVAVRLCEVTSDGWQIHDFLDFNPSAEEVRAERAALSAKRAEAGRKGAAARWQTNGKPDGNCHAVAMANGRQTDGPDPDPGREDPPPPSGAPPLAAEDGKPKREKPRTACPPSGATREDLLAWLAKHKIPADHAELDGFLDWHRKERRLSADWPASWRTWTRNAAKWNRGSGTRIASAHVQPVPEDGPLWKVGGGL